MITFSTFLFKLGTLSAAIYLLLLFSLVLLLCVKIMNAFCATMFCAVSNNIGSGDADVLLKWFRQQKCAVLDKTVLCVHQHDVLKEIQNALLCGLRKELLSHWYQSKTDVYSLNDDHVKVFYSHARYFYGKCHLEGTCVWLDISSKSTDNVGQYFQNLYGINEKYELKGLYKSIYRNSFAGNIYYFVLKTEILDTICAERGRMIRFIGWKLWELLFFWILASTACLKTIKFSLKSEGKNAHLHAHKNFLWITRHCCCNNWIQKVHFYFPEYLITIFELLFHRNCLFCKSWQNKI